MNFCLEVRQKALDIAHIALVNQGRLPQIALTLRRLFGENVACKCLLTLKLAGSGKLETLLGATVGFEFWHL